MVKAYFRLVEHLNSLLYGIRVKSIIEEIENEEAALREDLYSADRKFGEYYNVCRSGVCSVKNVIFLDSLEGLSICLLDAQLF